MVVSEERHLRFWWVNHKQTVIEEVTGGFLWAPFQEANGNRSQFYDNLKIASPGDKVVSYTNGLVGHLGTVSGFALPSRKPAKHSRIDSDWSEIGWLLPVAWTKLRSPFSVREQKEHLESLWPQKYSPIRPSTGTGNQKAYLCEISSPLFDFVTSKSKTSKDTKPQADVVREAAADFDLDADLRTESRGISVSRLGQQKWRRRVIAIEPKCRVTGIDLDFLLIASHIKPWRCCLDAGERLDPNNGLMLSPTVDWLFDRGLITFLSGGQVSVSKRIRADLISKLSIGDLDTMNIGSFSEEQSKYLNFHNNRVFIDAQP